MATQPIELGKPTDAVASVHADGTVCTCGELKSKRISLDMRQIDRETPRLW